jgi:hypothetical protein
MFSSTFRRTSVRWIASRTLLVLGVVLVLVGVFERA